MGVKKKKKKNSSQARNSEGFFLGGVMSVRIMIMYSYEVTIGLEREKTHKIIYDKRCGSRFLTIFYLLVEHKKARKVALHSISYYKTQHTHTKDFQQKKKKRERDTSLLWKLRYECNFQIRLLGGGGRRKKKSSAF